MSIGYETQIPPISTLTFYNGVANGGKLVAPRFVTEVRRGNEVVQEYPTVVLRERMCKPEVLRNIQICLEGVVGKNTGTGKLAYSKNFAIAGKTGTAQIWSKEGFASNYLVSFAGYFPADHPRYSMIVCIEKGAPAYGGIHCCPVFKKVAEGVMAKNRKTDYKAAIDTTALRTVPPMMQNGNLVTSVRCSTNYKYLIATTIARRKVSPGVRPLTKAPSCSITKRAAKGCLLSLDMDCAMPFTA